MGVPSSASIANAPTSSWPQGLYLSADIRRSVDSDKSLYDEYPDKNPIGELPVDYKAETYLSRLAGYNNTTPDRGVVTWGTNKLPSRGSVTEEVRMGDFVNFTTTTLTTASANFFSNFADLKNVPPSASLVDFTAPNHDYYQDGLVYPIAYIDTSADPRLGILFVSTSRDVYNAQQNNISQTGSNFDIYPYDFDINYGTALDTNATVIAVDNGTVGSIGVDDDEGRMRGVVAYTNSSNDTYVVPYEVSGSAPTLTVQYTAKLQLESSTTLAGNSVLKVCSPGFSVPGFSDVDNMDMSSMVFYMSNNTLSARLVTVSGSNYNGDTQTTVYSGSRFNLVNYPNRGINDKAYIAVAGKKVGNNDSFVTVLHGETGNLSEKTDNVVKLRWLAASHYQNTGSADFYSDPDSFLDITDFSGTGKIIGYANPMTVFTAATKNYGAKGMCAVSDNYYAGGTNENGLMVAVATTDRTIDLKYVKMPYNGTSYIPSVEGELIGSIGVNKGGTNFVDYQLPVGIVPLGSYTEYSASLAQNSSNYSGSLVEYFAVSYTRTDKKGATDIVKLYHVNGNIEHDNSAERVLNYNSLYDVGINESIPMLPQLPIPYSAVNGTGMRPINNDDYLSSHSNRPAYFFSPMIFQTDYSNQPLLRNYIMLH